MSNELLEARYEVLRQRLDQLAIDIKTTMETMRDVLGRQVAAAVDENNRMRAALIEWYERCGAERAYRDAGLLEFIEKHVAMPG